MCRRKCLIGAALIAFGAGLLFGCILGSAFLHFLIGIIALVLGLILFLR